MKLKTKFQDEDFKLGEVVDANFYHGMGKIRVNILAHDTIYDMYYDSIKDFTDRWEDVPEEQCYYINSTGEVREGILDADWRDERRIGNFFKTKEEAEKVVEKFEAWKRLKDKGFRFTEWGVTLNDELIIKAKYSGKDIYEDMNLLFKGEE